MNSKMAIILVVAAIMVLAFVNFTRVSFGPVEETAIPEDYAIIGLTDSLSTPVTIDLTREVEFAAGRSLNTESIASRTGNALSADQLCIFAGDFSNNNQFAVSGTTNITYTGTTTQLARLNSICDQGSELAKDLTSNPSLGQLVNLNSCGCSTASTTCCLIVIRNSWQKPAPVR